MFFVFTLIGFFWIKESPLFLLSTNRFSQFQEVMQYIAKTNNKGITLFDDNLNVNELDRFERFETVNLSKEPIIHDTTLPTPKSRGRDTTIVYNLPNDEIEELD